MKTLMIILGAFTSFLTVIGLSYSFGQSAQTNASNLNQTLIYGVLTLIFYGIAYAIPDSRGDSSKENLISKLESLENMLKKEIISQEEFEKAKRDLFNN